MININRLKKATTPDIKNAIRLISPILPFSSSPKIDVVRIKIAAIIIIVQTCIESSL